MNSEEELNHSLTQMIVGIVFFVCVSMAIAIGIVFFTEIGQSESRFWTFLYIIFIVIGFGVLTVNTIISLLEEVEDEKEKEEE